MCPKITASVLDNLVLMYLTLFVWSFRVLVFDPCHAMKCLSTLVDAAMLIHGKAL